MAQDRDPERMIHSEMDQLRSLRGKKDELQTYWEERYSETYTTLFEDRSKLGRYGVIAEYLARVVREGLVLDAGCGPGILATLLPAPALSYVGIDIAPEAIRLAKAKNPGSGVRFYCSALEDFRTPERYQAIVANEILYYVDDREFMKHVDRLLAPGGHFVASLYDFDEGRKLIPVIAGMLKNPFTCEVYNDDKKLKWVILAGELLRNQ